MKFKINNNEWEITEKDSDEMLKKYQEEVDN